MQPSNQQYAYDYPPAPGGARVGAFIVDLITIGVANSFLIAVGIDEQIISQLLPIVYFTVCHTARGQTLGKYLFKLKVVSASGGDSNNVVHILLRESIGRFISTIVFCAGYIRALVADDSRGFHDMIGKTNVVSLNAPSREAGFPIWKGFAIAAGVVAAICVLAVYSLLYTSVPLQSFADKAAADGIQIDGIDGSIATGFTIERFATSNDRGEVELIGLDVKYDLFELMEGDKFRIKNVSVKSGKIKLASLTAPPKNERKEEAEKNPTANAAPLEPRKKLSAVLIERIDIANLVFEGAVPQPFTLTRFYIDQLNFQDSKITLGQVYVESDLGDLNIGEATASKKYISMTQLAKGNVKSGVAPKFLKKDISFEWQASGDLESKSIDKLYVAMMDRRLQIRKVQDGYVLQSYGLTPGDFLKSSTALNNISIRTGGSANLMSLLSPADGSLSVRTIPFKFEQGRFVHRRGDRAFSMNVDWMKLGMTGFQAKGALSIDSKDHTSAEEWLADLYWGKKLAELPQQHQQMIAVDMQEFIPLIAPDLQMPMGLASSGQMPGSPPVTRDPASLVVTSPQAREAAKKQIMEMIKADCARGNQKSCEILKRSK